MVLSGAVVSTPSSKAAIHFGKAAVVSVGAISLIISCGVFFVFSNEQLGTWFGIIPMLLLYGVGRGIWVCTLDLMTCNNSGSWIITSDICTNKL